MLIAFLAKTVIAWQFVSNKVWRVKLGLIEVLGQNAWMSLLFTKSEIKTISMKQYACVPS